MIGHAVSNVIPVVAANRVGTEDGQTFYGSSFIANHRGDKVAELGRDGRRGHRCATFDRDQLAADASRLGLLPRPAARPLRRARRA